MSTISVVIPCYNVGEFLADAVETVRRQTRQPDELIIVNDGSDDTQTLNVLSSLENQGVRVIHSVNQGAPAARNLGISHARGEFILCLDGDDLLLPTFLEETVPILEAGAEVGMVSPHVEFFGEHEGNWQTAEYSFTTLLWQNCICTGSLFRRICWEQTGGYKSLKGCQDWEFWISIAEKGWKWSIVPKSLYRYRRRKGSISEYREANRAEILRQMIALHQPTYREHLADVVIQMDAELQRLRTQVARLTKGKVSTPTAREAADHRGRVRSLQEAVQATVPPGAQCLVIAKGDDELLQFEQRAGAHFPQSATGQYAGYHPADSAEAITHLENLRTGKADYLVIPWYSLWWLDSYPEFRQHLEYTYRSVLDDPEIGVIFNIAAPAEKHTFSVVVCTYKRAEYLGAALESLFAQNYPKDKYEIIVIDNNSPDDTADVAQSYAARSPVPFTYEIEKRNGLSFARNLGVEKAANQYVAFLDDDATAVPHWLAAFNSVINNQHALVVGGRVEKVFESGFEPPQWFNEPYVRGFFGINYRERGRTQRVFRIRWPLYIGGGNSAYARRLFSAFGGYDPQLGRNGTTLLAGEESYLNMLMDKHEIPIYYSDDASIDHFIESRRLTKQHIVRKAYWSGVTNAILYSMFFGVRDTRGRSRQSLHEIAKLLRSIANLRGDQQNFGRWCRVAYNASFLWKMLRISVANWLGRWNYQPPAVSWRHEDWIAEVETWPDGEHKFRQLYELHQAHGNVLKAEEALQALEAFLHERGCEGRVTALAQLWGPVRERKYQQLISQTAENIRENVPQSAHILVVSKGDDRFLTLPGWRLSHFPQERRGVYAGHYPADGQQAIEQLEALIEKGADHLVFPASSIWWLDHYRELREYLTQEGRLILQADDTCWIFALPERKASRNGHKHPEHDYPTTAMASHP